MPPEGIDASRIQARMDAIIGELSAEGFRVNVLHPADPALTQERRSALVREYAALADSLPPTGCRVGVLEINGRLGTDFAPPPMIDDCDPDIEADPYLTYMRELGQDWT